MSSLSDEDRIRRQYQTDHNLRIRQRIHDQYTVPPINYTNWVLNNIQLHGGEYILDIGCGSGLYYPAVINQYPDVHYFGLDISPGMLASHPAESKRLIVADGQELPFADNHFDVVFANHMLYHLSDFEQAIHEVRRVLKPEGTLVAATNSAQNLLEFQILLRRAVVLLTHHVESSVSAPSQPYELFSLEEGARMLSRYFYAVVRRDLPGALVFHDVEPAIEYLETTRDLRERDLPDDVFWEDVMMIMRQQIRLLIKNMGELKVSKLSGVFVATDNGDFITDFRARQNGNLQ